MSPAALRALPIFSDWSDESAAELIGRAQVLDVDAGDYLFRQGEPGSSLFVVLDGEVHVTLQTQDANEILLASGGPGTVLGEMALLDPGPRSASAVATSPSKCLGLSSDALDDLLWEAGATAHSLLRALTVELARRVQQTDGAIGDILRSAEQAGSAPSDHASEVWRLLWMGDA